MLPVLIVFAVSCGILIECTETKLNGSEWEKCSEQKLEAAENAIYNNNHCPDLARNNVSHCCKCAIKTNLNSTIARSYMGRHVHFNQLHRLRIIGGEYICRKEVAFGYLKLVYLYSCIFPTIFKANGEYPEDPSLAEMENKVINFNDISNLDSMMQRFNRTFLHCHAGNTENLYKHLYGFISDLKKMSNGEEEYKRPKKYRKFPNGTRHADYVPKETIPIDMEDAKKVSIHSA